MKVVLVIGNGSREHTLAWKLSLSPKVDKVYVAPGNGGTCNQSKISSLEINVNDNEEVVRWCKKFTPLLVIIGPEAVLNQGIVDAIQSTGIPCFGPNAAAAQIECDKSFAKDFMIKYNIPTAKYRVFTESTAAKAFARNADFNALVVKAAGLAAGKGVIICSNVEEVCEQIDLILDKKIFGSSGDSIILEEYLEGPEVSVLAFSDGKTFSVMPPAQDHKRAYDNDEGPNTGGMGAYAPCPLVDDKLLDEISQTVIKPAIEGLRKEGKPFIGALFAGLMLTENGPKVLEYNCRFGDPETQVILPLLESDLFDVCIACCTERLNVTQIKWKEDLHSVGVVVANGGYPGKVTNGRPINGIDKTLNQGLMVFQAGTKFMPSTNLLVTNGGRLLTVVAVESNLASAADKALKGAGLIEIEGSFYRKDIAKKAFENVKLDYKSSGVDIDAGNRLVDNIKVYASNTSRSGVIDSLGGFGALFDLKNAGYEDPILVSGTDGVGTKLRIAIDCKIYDTVGIDLVAMCVNDILVQGAEPLFFLDYFATAKLDVETASLVVKGISNGCEQANCGLIGGETAEMPGMYAKGDFDLAGFAVGAVNRDKILPKFDEIEEGDIVIGLSSSGLHSNGFSLVRKILQHRGFRAIDKASFDEKLTFGEAFLTPTKIYVKALLSIIKSGHIKALAHITGGGLTENIPRILPKHLGVELNAASWKIPKIFTWIYKDGNVPPDEMLKTFNCGIGMICIVNKDKLNLVLDQIKQSDSTVDSYMIGHIIKKVDKQVIVNNFLSALLGTNTSTSGSPIASTISKPKKKVAVLISGSGTTLQSLIDYVAAKRNETQIEISLVISNKANVQGIERAQSANIATKVIPHQGLKRAEYDQLIDHELKINNIEFVCLAGFMRILSEKFVETWKGRLINIHPSLLPMFPGLDTYKQALNAGVRVHGTTVHFVDTGVDTGAIIAQQAVQILVNEDEHSLQERVKKVEHQLFPQCVEYLVNGSVKLTTDGKANWTTTTTPRFN